MPVVDSFIRGLAASEKRQTVSLGDALFLIIEPSSKGGGKSFLGRMRFPPVAPKNGGKQVDVRIGVYGKGPGKWSLKDARLEWDRIRQWSKQTGRDPRDLKREEKAEVIKRSFRPTLEEACSSYLDSINIKTKDDYRKILNSVLPGLGGNISVEQFGWDYIGQSGKSGRELMIELHERIRSRGACVQADRTLMVLRQVFTHAIDSGWMPRDQNPASGPKSNAKKSRKPKHHPTLSWDELPKFFEDLELNQANGSLVTVAAIKVLFMTFLRVGSLVQIRWSDICYDEALLVVPGQTMKSGNDLVVPLTEPLLDTLEGMRRINSADEFLFSSPRSGGTPMNPSTLNQHFIRMGYKNRQTAHGVRALAMTEGKQILKFPEQIIDLQLGHNKKDKVQKAYDRAEMLDERREFMNAWCDALLAQGLKV